MYQVTATITSKRQLTIPITMYKKLGLEKGEKVVISEENGELRIKSQLKIIEDLAGSVHLPKRLQGIDMDKLIETAKLEYINSYS